MGERRANAKEPKSGAAPSTRVAAARRGGAAATAARRDDRDEYVRLRGRGRLIDGCRTGPLRQTISPVAPTALRRGCLRYELPRTQVSLGDLLAKRVRLVERRRLVYTHVPGGGLSMPRIRPGSIALLLVVASCSSSPHQTSGAGGATTASTGASATNASTTANGNSTNATAASTTGSVSGTSSSGSSSSGCTKDSDCALGPCNVCPPAVAMCIAPIAPLASLPAGVCKATAPACNEGNNTGTCGPIASFDVEAYGMAFDGTNMWVAPGYSQRITEVSLSGAKIGNFQTPGVSSDEGIAYDGTNMWVTDNQLAGTVHKLSPTGATLGTFPAGMDPAAIAFDGTNMWVVNSSALLKVSPSGATLGTFSMTGGPSRIAFDGTNMWVTRISLQNVPAVAEFSPTGAVIGTFPLGVTQGGAPNAIAFDGTNMWVTSPNGTGNVTELSPTGAILGTFPTVPDANLIAFDGTNMWIASTLSIGSVTKLSSSGAKLTTFNASGILTGIMFDGTNMWVAGENAHALTKL